MKQKIISLSEQTRKEILDGIIEFGKIKITGLGTFKLRDMKGRNGTNPATMKPQYIKDYKKLTFKPTSTVKRLYKN